LYSLNPLYSYPTDIHTSNASRSLLSLAYKRIENTDTTEDDEYFGRLRYRYRPDFHIFLTSSIRDTDVDNRMGKTAANSIEFRWRVKNNLKVNLEFMDLWDESKQNSENEHTSTGRINYYYNF